jgi:hypothetical protein
MPGKRRMSQPLLASLTRIADFHWSPYDVHPLAHEHWSNGDYVLTEVTGTPSDLYQVEACEGNMVPVKPGDQVIGALGHREATLEGVGSYLDVVNNQMHALTSAGLLGVFTSFGRYRWPTGATLCAMTARSRCTISRCAARHRISRRRRF